MKKLGDFALLGDALRSMAGTMARSEKVWRTNRMIVSTAHLPIRATRTYGREAVTGG